MSDTGIVSPWEDPERVLAYGGEGVGKTKAAIDILLATGAKGWVVDTDRAWGRVIDSQRVPEDQLCLYDVRAMARAETEGQWEVFIRCVQEASRKMAPDDWLIVDMASIAWQWAQTYFSQQVFGKSSQDFLVEARARGQAAGKQTGNFDGMHDWPAITRIHGEFYDEVLLANGHVWLIAEGKGIRADLPQSEEVKTVYGPTGMQPVGQRSLGHNCHTIVHMGRTLDGGWAYTTVKDREPRVGMKNVRWGDFAGDYLKKHAGWARQSVIDARAKAPG